MAETRIADRYGDPRIEFAWDDVDCVRALEQQFQIKKEYNRAYSFIPSQGDAIVEVLRKWFPVVRDNRVYPSIADVWTESSDINLDAYLPFLLELEKVDKALQNIEQYYGDLSQFSDVPHCWPLLRVIGCYKEPERESYGNIEPESWHTHDQAKNFLSYLTRYLKEGLTSTVQDDRSVVQFLEEAGVKKAWEQARSQFGKAPQLVGEKFYPKNDDAGAWIVTAFARLSGFTFTSRFERRLPRWLIQVPANAYQLSLNGKGQYIVSWACMSTYQSDDKAPVVLHISAVGGIVALRGLHAHLMDGRRNTIELRTGNGRYVDSHARREEGRGRYYTSINDEELPRSGWAHMDITHISATNPPQDESILHLVGNMENAEPDIDLFFRQLDQAVSVPLKEEWKDKLWEYGLLERRGRGSQMLIDKLSSFNCTAWLIWPDETRWTRIVVALIKGVVPNQVTSLDVETMADEAQKDEDLIAVIGEEEDNDDSKEEE